ncbi:MAG: phosphotransferase, partial [Chloroflexi bacterium]|nr:phosphotransferase [Chloroflexota bacterium]
LVPAGTPESRRRMNSSAASPLNEGDRARFERLLREASAAALPAWMETRRWFADKGRGIATIEIEDAIVERVESNWLALAVARVAFKDGNTARYLLPLTLTGSGAKTDDVIAAAPGSDAGALIDATETPWFGEWLLARLAESKGFASGAWSYISHPAAETEIALARSRRASVMRAEQSNSSIRFGDVLIMKLFRRLQPGPNPDEEVLRALLDAGFARVPRYIGSVSWRSTGGQTFAVAVIQEFVPNVGDGWTWMLDRLRAIAAGGIDVRADDFAAEQLLGRRTGELHLALSSVSEPGFAPEQPDRATVASDTDRTRAAIEETIGLLLERQVHLPEKIQTRLPEAIAGLRALSGRVDGYADEAQTRRIRVHGDYHLGQTLRTPDGDWTIIDFEGEPARPLEERRQRSSVLKDVAGMLRSFAYARGAAERAADLTGDNVVRVRLQRWESGVRGAFLTGYRQALDISPLPLIPVEDEAFGRALAAWELDKALYEVAYEARNRPDWIELPLRALLPDLFDQPADGPGTAPA